MFYPPDLHNSTHLLCTLCFWVHRIRRFFNFFPHYFICFGWQLCSSRPTTLLQYILLLVCVFSIILGLIIVSRHHHANQTNYFHSTRLQWNRSKMVYAYWTYIVYRFYSPSHTKRPTHAINANMTVITPSWLDLTWLGLAWLGRFEIQQTKLL